MFQPHLGSSHEEGMWSQAKMRERLWKPRYGAYQTEDGNSDSGEEDNRDLIKQIKTKGMCTVTSCGRCNLLPPADGEASVSVYVTRGWLKVVMAFSACWSAIPATWARMSSRTGRRRGRVSVI